MAMDWPLEYWVTEGRSSHGGLAVDGSEMGLRIQSIQSLRVGMMLKVAVIFRRGFELTDFDVLAEIVWKDICGEEEKYPYQYGLKFIHIHDLSLQKLKKLLGVQS